MQRRDFLKSAVILGRLAQTANAGAEILEGEKMKNQVW